METLKQLGPLALVAALLAALAATLAGQKAKGKRPFKAQRREPLTKHEQPMFHRLAQTFPEHIVLAQVGFGALMSSKDKSSLNRFNQKRADFVLCSKAFEVLAVIELDDSSHKTNRGKDNERDAMLAAVNLRVLRYQAVPDAETLKRDVFPPTGRTPKR